MVENNIIEAVTSFTDCLIKGNIRPSKIILFGSYADGKPANDSDLDIIVISEDFRDKDIFERAEMTRMPEIMTIKKFMINTYN